MKPILIALLFCVNYAWAQGPPIPPIDGGGGGARTNSTPAYTNVYTRQHPVHGAIKTATMTMNVMEWWNFSDHVFTVEHRLALADGSWTNIGEGYKGYKHNDPDGFYRVLESPRDVVIQVRNSGTSNLLWSASTTSEWATLECYSSNIPPEQGEGHIIARVDSNAPPSCDIVVHVQSLNGYHMTHTIAAQVGRLPEPEITGPTASYTFPGDFSPFDITSITTNDLQSNVPEICAWTQQNNPGDTMALTAEGLSSNNTAFLFAGNEAECYAGDVQRMDGRYCAVTLPPELAIDEAYLMWVRNQYGFSLPRPINTAIVHWLSDDHLPIGGKFSVIGENLSLNGGDSYVYIEELDLWLTSVSANPYKADFIVPAGVTNGTYTAWSHNGHGLEYGWAKKPLPFTVITETQWTGSTYDVTTYPYNATGNGSTDDHAAIQAAINAAAVEEWSTVHFPTGTYLISDSLSFDDMDKMRITGAGMDSTTIKPHSTWTGDALVMGGGGWSDGSFDNSEFKDLTFETTATKGQKLFNLLYSDFVKFDGVRFSQAAFISPSESVEYVDLDHSRYVTLTNCEFIACGKLAFAGISTQITIDDCSFYGIHDNDSYIFLHSAGEAKIINCFTDNYNTNLSTGWGQGRFINTLSVDGNPPRHIYIADNVISNSTPGPDGDPNSGEIIMCEGESTDWRDSPTASTADSVTLSGITSAYVNDAITVISGRGLGQVRYITGISGGKVTIDHDWDVVPDTSSTVIIGNHTHHMIIYNNYFGGTQYGLDNNRATTGFEPWGAALNWIADGNTISKTRSGFAQFARYHDSTNNDPGKHVVSPHFFNIYKNQTIDQCRYGMWMYTKEYTTVSSYYNDPAYCGVVIRGTTFTNIITESVHYDTDEISVLTDLNLTVFDNNSFQTTGENIVEMRGINNHIWIGNTFSGNGTGVGIDIAEGHIPALRDNIWNGFSSDYAGELPGSVLELPRRSSHWWE